MTHFLISKDSYWDGSPGQEDHDSFSDFQEIWNAPFSHPRCASPRQRRCEQHTVEENSWLFRVAPNWSGDLTPVARLSLRRFFEVKSNDFFEANFLEGDFKVSFTCIVEWIHKSPRQFLVNQYFSQTFEELFSKKNHKKSSHLCEWCHKVVRTQPHAKSLTQTCGKVSWRNRRRTRILQQYHNAIVDGYCDSMMQDTSDP